MTPVDYQGNQTWEVNSTTGMIGTPQQTNLGVVARVLPLRLRRSSSVIS